MNGETFSDTRIMNVGDSAVQPRIPTIEILGIPFSTLTFDETIELLAGWMKEDQPRQVVTANPEYVMIAKENPQLAAILREADLVTPDGIGAVMAGRLFGAPLEGRVTGADMLPRLLDICDREKYRVYALGSKPEANQLALQRFRREYPHVHFAGRDGYFIESDVPDILDEIKQHRPHLLLVGLGMGKQDAFIAKYKKELGVPVSIAIGGSLDVFAGTVKRAPLIWQKMHIEWLYRLLKQPSRWRRQLVLPKFAILVLSAYIRGRFQKN
ncbi:acetylglucosaminyldiphosphoundecaprenol acetyl-beta-D-mannosaminyltransferase [Collibacillus ludicampi]|uniref:N-acetylglucosaminyldiphosphoundecaprenol N-acetyl-beta-D-mannosaminyltransferase n=1 Tax=Collibacillus ludicampi TaxID=2771369 RepID=A0AAV4LCP0_9BACL|nr:WecB/TagA/CpsF family glycosyltransferase [Collibacillus ludicampi]GIM45575.1 acetylglucosaminyldiphosphoundecaprenol acetyl-beta-D-mannosaminyltransferase [Collibacillus ludicampi]